MKKQFFIAAGIAGMLLGAIPQQHADAAITVHVRTEGRPAFVISSWPSFIYLPKYGFSVSMNTAYDIIYFKNYYYVYRQGYWFRASSHRGPWEAVRQHKLPWKIRQHRWSEIKRYRDRQYRMQQENRWTTKDRYKDQYRDRNDRLNDHRDNRDDGRNGHGNPNIDNRP